MRIKSVRAREILDSRGIPTVLATCELADGVVASASVPSGRSTGANESVELRDGNASRYRGKGCRRAVANVNGEINEALSGSGFDDQKDLDDRLIRLDGTINKSRLGANALLAVSLAFARAWAKAEDQPLYNHFASMLGSLPEVMPRLTINLFSGGRHAGRQVCIQDVLIIPSSSKSIDASLVMMHSIYHAAVERLSKEQDMRWLTADEGGLAPQFERAEDLIAAAVEAIRDAGYSPGDDAQLAIDVASSHFFEDNGYMMDGARISADQMIDCLETWVGRYPIVSIEDGLSEDQWSDWPKLNQRLGGKVLVLGDDLLCTNPDRIRRAIDAGACNALLLKVNQIGTLTEAARACGLAREAGWAVTISARSGETEDDWLADLAVGWRGDQTKIGSITQSERLAKYNRLLAIEAETNFQFVPWPNLAEASQ